MRFPHACTLVSPLLLALSLGFGTANAQRLAPAGVRPLTHPSPMPPADAAADPRAIHPGPASPLFRAPGPTDGAWHPRGTYDRLALERDQPSLWKHLVVGTLGGAALGYAVSSVAYSLSCEGDACAWAGLGVMVSTGLGAGVGLLAGGAVYVWKRARQ